MAGLGSRGQAKAATTNALFSKTEKQENNNAVKMEKTKMVPKTFQLPEDLADALRTYAFETRRKEVDVVREALYNYLQK